MAIKKIAYWGTIFSLLLVFSGLTVAGGGDYGMRLALAEALAQESDIEDGDTVVMLSSQDREAFLAERRAAFEERRWSWFLRRFGRLHEDGVVCRLSDEQLQALSVFYDPQVESLEIDDRMVSVATFADGAPGRQLLRRVIQDTGDTDRCRVVRFNRMLYVLMGGAVS